MQKPAKMRQRPHRVKRAWIRDTWITGLVENSGQNIWFVLAAADLLAFYIGQIILTPFYILIAYTSLLGGGS